MYKHPTNMLSHYQYIKMLISYNLSTLSNKVKNLCQFLRWKIVFNYFKFIIFDY